MKQNDPENPVLTKNDEEVLKTILDQAKLPDAEIARKLRLSQQAIQKIRAKLEDKGIIQGYMPIIDFKKIGIYVLTVMAIRVKPLVWETCSEEDIRNRIRTIPHIITAYRLPESEFTHLLILGFRDIEQKDRFMMLIQTRFANEIEIVHVYPTSVNRIITNSPIGLLREVIGKKEYVLDKLFLEK